MARPRSPSGGAGEPQPPLLLASRSPRRRAILEQLGIRFEAVDPDYVERDLPKLDPIELVRRHAEGKARSARGLARPSQPVLGVDTGVLLHAQLFGKPTDADDARRILGELSGHTHQVVSGLCLIRDWNEQVAHSITEVTFRPLAPPQLDAYVASGEWKGLAGGYAIQGRGAVFVTRIAGDYLNVVGLPAALLIDLLEEQSPAASKLRS